MSKKNTFIALCFPSVSVFVLSPYSRPLTIRAVDLFQRRY